MKFFNTAAFTLLEILLAIFLGILALSGSIMAYLSLKSNYMRQQLVSDLLDNTRFVGNLLNQRIATAGFIGCQSAEMVDKQQGIMGYSGDHLPLEWQNQVVSKTDMFIIKSCVSHSHLSQDAKVIKMAYFIGDTHRVNSLGTPILALFEKPDGEDRLELASGVEQMQILYGISDIAKQNLVYYPAIAVHDWSAVRGLQIDLVLNSIEPALKHPHSYNFQGQTITPNDSLIHNPWSIYVHLREW